MQWRLEYRNSVPFIVDEETSRELCAFYPYPACDGDAQLAVTAPLLRTMLRRLLDEVMMSEDVFSRIAPLTLEHCRQALETAGVSP